MKGGQFTVDYEDGSKSTVGRADVKPISPKLKVSKGQKVFSLWEEDGTFYLGTVSEVKKTGIVIAWDDGGQSASIPFGSFTTDVAGLVKGSAVSVAGGKTIPPWYQGSKAGEVEPNGRIWKDGSRVGGVEPNGRVWRGGSQVGEAPGLKLGWTAAIYFFFFFEERAESSRRVPGWTGGQRPRAGPKSPPVCRGELLSCQLVVSLSRCAISLVVLVHAGDIQHQAEVGMRESIDRFADLLLSRPVAVKALQR